MISQLFSKSVVPLFKRALQGMLMGCALALALIALMGLRYPEQLWDRTDLLALATFTFFGLLYKLASSSDTISLEHSIARFERAEASLQQAPSDQNLAWGVARAQIELYVNRNQSQQRNIYGLTVAVILCGFVLIAAGIVLSFRSALQPGLLAASCGILVNFVGATFLLIYKNTISQAKDYIVVLERINAVGMAMQVLDNIEAKPELRDETKAKISLALLDLYQLRRSEA